MLERVAISSSRGSSPPRDRTEPPALAVKFFTDEPPGEQAEPQQQQRLCFQTFKTQRWVKKKGSS